MRRRRVLTYSFLALTLTAAAAGYAVNRLLDRPGETALAWVPANAVGALSLDLVPAPDQVLAFKSIDDMIAKAGDAAPKGPLIGSLLHMAVDEPVMKPLADQVDRSIALVGLPKRDPKQTDEEGVALLPIRDSAKIAAFLAKGKSETVEGISMRAFKLKSGETVHLVLQDSTVVAATAAWAVADVIKVAQGKAPALVDTPGFGALRAKALPSANLIALISPKIAKGTEWTIASMTIRDTGVEFATTGQTTDPDVLKMAGANRLGVDALSTLPRGAYGFSAQSQPNRMMGLTMGVGGKEMEEMAKEMKKEIGLDLKEDILPALGGNALFAFYPSLGGDAGLDLLYVIDDANGADPASLARKLRKALVEKLEDQQPGALGKWIEPLPTPGLEGDRLADESAVEMEKGLRELEKSYFRPLTLSRGKTVAWAIVGKSVIFATSQSLLDRAVALRKSPSRELSLASDPAFGAQPEVAADGQLAMAISMKRLVEGVRNTIDPSHMSVETAKVYRQGLELFENVTEPFAVRGTLEGDGHFSGYLSIPFDWTKLVQLSDAVMGVSSPPVRP